MEFLAQGWRIAGRILAIAAGFLSLLAGLVFLPLPTPFGIPLIALGLTLVLGASHTARRHFKSLRMHNQTLDASLRKAETYLPRRVRFILSRTRPGRHKL